MSFLAAAAGGDVPALALTLALTGLTAVLTRAPQRGRRRR